MANTLTFAVGDIHGCFDELRSLLDFCAKNAANHEYEFILLGDYVDRGPASNEVLAFLKQEQSAGRLRLRCLLGNHDQMLCLAASPSRTDAELMRWWGNGGDTTLDAYGISDPSDMPADDLAWLQSLPLKLHENNRFFVHAGVRPGVSLDEQSDQDLLWIREPFLSSTIWHGALVVHGHTPTVSGAPEVFTNRVNVDTGACFGRSLTAAAFRSDKRSPVFFVTSDGLRYTMDNAAADR